MLETEWFCGRGIEDEQTHTACAGARRVGLTILICGIGLALVGILGGCARSPAPAAAPEVEIPLHVYERGRTSIRLMRGPCVDPYSLAFITRRAPEYAERAHAIASTWPMSDGSRRDYAGCWLEFTAKETGGEASFVLIFEDGQRFTLTKSEVVGGGV